MDKTNRNEEDFTISTELIREIMYGEDKIFRDIKMIQEMEFNEFIVLRDYRRYKEDNIGNEIVSIEEFQKYYFSFED